jgi:hypothetical protein
MLDQTFFATLLAIAILRKLFADRRSQWLLIERKALEWLSCQIPEPEAVIERLIAAL